MDKPQKTFDEVEPGFYGHSVGRWEGDTLVVDTIGIKENVRFQNMPHSPQMRITERMKLVSPTVLWNEITIDDPMTLEKPHTYTVAYRRMPNYTLLEYVCEDNREYADDKGLQKIANQLTRWLVPRRSCCSRCPRWPIRTSREVWSCCVTTPSEGRSG